jgi:hypothetical protein
MPVLACQEHDVGLLPSLMTLRFLVSHPRSFRAKVKPSQWTQEYRAAMKSHIRTKGPTFPARLRGPRAAGRVLDSIKNITSELEDLQADIYSRMGGPIEMLEGFSRRERESAERALSDFKLALDQLRYVLWLSLEPRRGELPEKETAARTETPARLAPPEEPSAEAPTSASFFDRLDVVIEAYMNKNAASGSATRKRLKN